MQPIARTAAQTLSKKTLKFARNSYDDTKWSGGTLGQIRHVLKLKHKKECCENFCRDFKRAFAALDKSNRLLLYCAYIADVDRGKLRRHLGYSPTEFNANLARARSRFSAKLSELQLDARWLGATMGEFFGVKYACPTNSVQSKLLCNSLAGKIAELS